MLFTHLIQRTGLLCPKESFKKGVVCELLSLGFC